MIDKRIKHGDCVKAKNKRTRLNIIWTGIKQRCYNKNSTSYKYYGMKGITVYDEWLNSYIAFKNWSLNNGYNDSLVIDRIDNSKGYCPENCRWITLKESNRNKTKTKLTMKKANKIRDMYFNKNISRKNLSILFNMSYWVICDIINKRRWI